MEVATEQRAVSPPTREELEALYRLKYGAPETTGWSPRMRHKFGYSTPADVYEALLARLVTEETDWLEVGCGRFLFPSNEGLAKELSARCRRLVGVDPDETIHENVYVHEKVCGTIDDLESGDQFDLVTLNMVAEHITHPEAAVDRIAKLTRPGGLVLVYTVFKYSPVPIVTALTPLKMHHAVKRRLWGTEEKDTFPVANKMNTRGSLRQLFEGRGFKEAHFAFLDDCRSFQKYRLTQWVELALQRALRAVNLHYPEVCLLGVYEKLPGA